MRALPARKAKAPAGRQRASRTRRIRRAPRIQLIDMRIASQLYKTRAASLPGGAPLFPKVSSIFDVGAGNTGADAATNGLGRLPRLEGAKRHDVEAGIKAAELV